jgi:adenosine deaminase
MNALPDLKEFQRLPKVDLHRHLEGSLRLETLRELAPSFHLDPASLAAQVQMQPGDAHDFATFLSKFPALRQFYQSPEIIMRLTAEAVADAALDGVHYLELRFTPVALSRARGFAPGEVMDWVIAAAEWASAAQGITTRLIASVNRHESPALAEEVARLAAERKERGIVALDLAGNEADYPAEPFIDIFRQARACGLKTTVHAGEWGGPENVIEAIEKLGADRIAHGVRVLEDPCAVALARERQTPFEVCLTSNYQTGVCSSLQAHPFLKMLQAGLNVTLNTDDPSISNVTLSSEYRTACELGLPFETLLERIRAAEQAKFGS